MNEETIFHLALEKPSSERAALLDDVCEKDADLRRRVERLLAEHERGESFILDSPAANFGATIDSPFTERPGTVIGPYKLLQQIGAGGMGVVFMAEQTEPIQRTVALKIIKPGMDTRQVIARFEAERQALAMTDHPNIAKVLDAGTSNTGRPYFVMELVKGLPITKYSDDKRLSLRERLELYLPVCQAIQHAHQKGIIHRDVKPTNVLVAEYDNRPVPKIIDFGVAKATAQRLTERTMFTEFGQVIGTIEYMSPEQAKLNQLDIDTRSDIYSLGVLLYELLTGSTPFEQKRLREVAFDEVLRIIREEEPPKPSTKLSSSDMLPSIAANRHTEPVRLNKDIIGELDWIVMKALEKDRNRRYGTASGLAADIERHLRDEPVEAGPPSAVYRFGKFARRNKAALVAGLVVAAALCLGLIGTTWQAIRATHAERMTQMQLDRAIEAEKLAKTASARANQEASHAKTEADIARQVNYFLNYDLLAQANPLLAYDRFIETTDNVKLATVLDRAAQRIEGRFSDRPLVEAALRQTIGHAYGRLQRVESSQVHLQRALDLRRENLGEDHPDTLLSMSLLAWAKNDFELTSQVAEARARVLGKDHPDTLQSKFDLTIAMRGRGETARAVILLREVLESQRRVLGEEHLETAWSMSCLAHTVVMHPEVTAIAALSDAEIESMLRRALAITRKSDGETWRTYAITQALGRFLHSRHRYEEAELLLRDGLARLDSMPGAAPKMRARLAGELAYVYREDGKPAAAEPLLRQALAIVRKELGDEDEATATLMHDLAFVLIRIPGHDAEAEQLYRQALGVRRQRLGAGDAATADSAFRLAQVVGNQGKLDEAEALLLDAHAALVANRASAPARAYEPVMLGWIADLYRGWNKPEKAEEWERKRAAATTQPR